MLQPSRIVSIILAAGKGTRMGETHLHKVCHPVAGTPVIVRSLETYQRAGVAANLLVVGQYAEQVIHTAAAVPAPVMYCYQSEQKGTGHATKIAASLLEAQGYAGDILVVAGDKVLEDSIVERLIATYYAEQCTLAFVVGAVEHFPVSGRIVTDAHGSIIGNVEVFDIQRMRLLIELRERVGQGPLPADEVKRMALDYFKQDKRKTIKALGVIWEHLQHGHPVDWHFLAQHTRVEDYALNINNRQYAPELLDHVRYTNLSVYLFKASALYRTLQQLGSANAQHEEYLTDLIGMLAAENARVEMVPLRYPQEAMAFNTQAEFDEIEAYYTRDAAPVV